MTERKICVVADGRAVWFWQKSCVSNDGNSCPQLSWSTKMGQCLLFGRIREGGGINRCEACIEMFGEVEE